MEQSNYWVYLGTKYAIHPLYGIYNLITKKRLSGYKQQDGYPTVKLDGKLYKIHILVALAFIPNPNNHPIVNHKDGNKENYNISNLEWTTYGENNKHAMETGLRKKRVRGVEIDLLDEENNVIKTFENIKLAAMHVNRTDRTLSEHFKNNLLSDNTIKVNGFRLRKSLPVEDLKGEFWKFVMISKTEIIEEYKISNKGRVKYVSNGRLLPTHKNVGYLSVNIRKVPIHIHRLMAFTFLETPDDGKFDVNHINKDKELNHLENLEVLSRADHITKDHGRKTVGRNGEEILFFPSLAAAAKAMNVRSSSIRKSIVNGSKSVGYNWSYE